MPGAHVLLVIDDELGPRESIRFLFKDEYDVVCVESVDEGLEAIKEHSPDVIILDIKMPGKNGIDGLQEIRAIEPLTSIIMLTGFGSLRTAQLSIRHGANDYIRKPFDTKEMRETVKKYVQRSEMEKRRSSASRELNDLNVKMRRELAQKEHLAELGQTSSEFVHDLRNPLTVIYGYVHLLMEEIEDSNRWIGAATGEATEYLSVIEKNVQRCESMLNQWREKKKPGSDARQVTTVSSLLGEIAENCLPIAAEAAARISLSPAPLDCEILADVMELHRAIQNLVTNAIQALPEEGGLVQLAWMVMEDYVEISVQDNGPGIPEEHVKDIFTPYYSTKKQTGGMGLGLYITRNIIEDHDGIIDLQNDDDAGVTFRIRLPLHSTASTNDTANGANLN
ncbi:MAG: hybrid sensor histidine kinase/response regulator [Kiritimatiellia bacterium]|jgi:signal transduction histidine kinase|nr:hybrid sensor histidine kinase/response regulator [Kiritimatiellia bacterium]MDP6848610.1 hybrid sensor histidine kinase/response regulator [Kiritimatiellia bacterium]